MSRERCPRCGGYLRMLSGFKVCRECSHRMGSQCLDYDWTSHDNDLGRLRARSSDEQTRPERRHNPRRRLPLRLQGNREYE